MKKPSWKKYCKKQWEKYSNYQYNPFIVSKRGNKWCIFMLPHTELFRDRVGEGDTKSQAWKSLAKNIHKQSKRKLVRPPPPPPRKE